MKLIKLFYLICVVTLLPLKTWAVLDLIVRGEIKVYKQATTKSKLISTLIRGDRVVISPKLYGSWRKVLVTYRGKRQGGFVQNKDIILSSIEERNHEEYNTFRTNKSISVSTNIVFELQSESDFDIVGFDAATIGSRSGYNYFLGIDYQMPVSSWGLLQFSLKKRGSELEGNAEMIPDGGRNMVEIHQNMISVGSFLKFYKDKSSFFWKGAGLEIAKVNSIGVNLTDGASLTYNGDLPTYIIGSVGMGWDYKWKENLYIIPEARASAIINASPIVLSGELILSLSWIF
ncbi:MAG: hypothetical protein HOO06_05405 [Bdellovibrionaceae bacterium]|jgi:hypothetical protein|nr:hypothetical protein [Pseudobdellovibrionaceae bacterium]